jgi:hypothetical protein
LKTVVWTRILKAELGGWILPFLDGFLRQCIYGSKNGRTFSRQSLSSVKDLVFCIATYGYDVATGLCWPSVSSTPVIRFHSLPSEVTPQEHQDTAGNILKVVLSSRFLFLRLFEILSGNRFPRHLSLNLNPSVGRSISMKKRYSHRHTFMK